MENINKTKFTNKIILVLLLSLFLLFTFNLTCFGVQYSDVVVGNTTIDFDGFTSGGSFENYRMLFRSTSDVNRLYLITCDKPFSVEWDLENNRYNCIVNDTISSNGYFHNYVIIFNAYNKDNNTYIVKSGSNVLNSLARKINSTIIADDYNSTNPITDIYIVSKTSDDLVFQAPPGVILAPIVEETPLEGVMKEIVEILPIVIVTIVGLIGLRKGLQLLSKVLHNS